MKYSLRVLVFLPVVMVHVAIGQQIDWAKDGSSFYRRSKDGIEKVTLPSLKADVVLTSENLVPQGKTEPLQLREYIFSGDEQKILVYTNSKKVWRQDTRGDYWLYDVGTKSLKQLGVGLPGSSMMFAKFSPDATQVAYVSNYNLYLEDLATNKITQLTKDGNRQLINGTFDWAYEEEFFCRDGFRWSPDGKHIAFWQIDANNTKDYTMLNTTDSIYPKVIPVEYPVAGEKPSRFKIGVIDIAQDSKTWMDIPTDPVLGSYVPRMEWSGNNELIVQHLNRKQNESQLMLCNIATGASKTIYSETDAAWIDIVPSWDGDYANGGWDWLKGGQEFLWASEKDGWRHLYRVSSDGAKETLITKGAYDVIDIVLLDEKGGYVYFIASPTNATQRYLYRTKLDGKGAAELMSPSNQQGTHSYQVSPNAKYAFHRFSNYYTPWTTEWITLADHKGFNKESKVDDAIAKSDKNASGVSFFKIHTADGIDMDAWMQKPQNFDSTKKYPVVFYVYTEPAGQTVKDVFGAANNREYVGDMAADGYFYISIDNRGTPAPKGSAWRKSVYRKIGLLNIQDQAMAAKEILKWPYIDTSRVAVWGWSGGGSATLNLMFQHPEIYKTGISIAAVGNQLTYDNIYQERYMGLPQENREDFIKGSPITYAKYLQGNLLYIHGTNDDNVHYSNAEMLINELVKYNRQFSLMSYPNRTHSISEGEGTRTHLATLFTQYLKQYCPPGGR